MKYKILLLLITTLLPTSAYAYISSDGDEYTAKYNEHGAVLTSSKKVTIYLGNNCDLSSKLYGKGTWAWANGGFILKFESKQISFGRQELHIEDDGDCSDVFPSSKGVELSISDNVIEHNQRREGRKTILDDLEFGPEDRIQPTASQEPTEDPWARFDFSDLKADPASLNAEAIQGGSIDDMEPTYLKEDNKIGHLPLVIIALLCCWLFTKVTGLDVNKILTKKRHITPISTYISYYKRYWKVISLVSVAILSIIFLYSFISMRQTPERCILKYAVHVKSKLASSILEQACNDLYDGSKLAKKVAKCKIQNIPKANNNTAVELAENVCNEYY